MDQNFNWLLCPVCNGKTRTHVLDGTTLSKFPLFCPKCKRTTIVNVQKKKITSIIKEPDASGAEPRRRADNV